MRAARSILVVLIALVSFRATALAEVWQERRITATTWLETGPKVWQAAIYYNDLRSGSADVFEWTPSTGSQPVIQGAGTQVVDAVYEDRIAYRAYSEEASGYADLYLWDPVGGSRLISNAPGDQTNADMYGDTVVWQDRRTANPQVYIWDPVNGERPISPTASAQVNPRIWGDTVVWEDDRNGRVDVYMWNPRDGERLISNYIYGMLSPDIYEDRVVMWMLDDIRSSLDEPGLWEWTPGGGFRRLAEIHFYRGWDVLYTQLWGDLVVWQSGVGPSGIGAWDPVNGQTVISGNGSLPFVYGNTVAWVGGYDIYLSTMVPEPSSLVSVIGLSAALLLGLRRRIQSQ